MAEHELQWVKERPEVTADPPSTREERLMELRFNSNQYEGMTHFESKPGTPGRPVGAEFLKGLAVGVPAFGPDILGAPIDPLAYLGPAAGAVRIQLAEQGINIADKQSLLNPITGEPFSGDVIRELVDLDPESGWGMLGEGLGGWENAVAKVPAIGKAVLSATAKAAPAGFLAWLMSKNPTPGQVNSTFGEIGARNLLGPERADATLEAAKRRIERGDDPLDVMVENSWWQDLDGKWKFFASDANTTLDVERIDKATKPFFRNMAVGEDKEIPFSLHEIISPNSPILKAYPDAARMQISISVQRIEDAADGTMQWKVFSSSADPASKAYWEEPGVVTNPMGRIGILHANDMADLKNSLFHEINHAIQFKEGHAAGADAGAIMQYMSDYSNSRLQKDVTLAAAEHGFEKFRRGGADAIYEFLENYYLTRNPDASPAEVADFSTGWVTYLEMGATKTPQEVQDHIGFLNDIVRQNEILAARYLGLGGETQEQTIQAIRAMNDPELARRAGQRYFQAGGERTSRMTEFFLNSKVEGIYDYFKRHGKMPYEMQEEIDKVVLRREGFLDKEIEAFGVDPEQAVQLTTEKLKDKLTQPISMRASSIRAQEMEKGANIVNVPIHGGRAGAKVKLLKNPTEREFRKWQKQNDDWSFRTLRTEDGDLFVWSAYSDALHQEMVAYLGHPKLADKDFYDAATNQDVIDMIAGNWYGNDL